MPLPSTATADRLTGLAVVTGAGGGIGRQIALHLAARGARIAILDIDLPAAERVAGEIVREGAAALALQCDVADADAVAAAFDAVRRQCGPVAMLVNNAGVVSAPGMPFTRNTEADWDRTFAINVKALTFTAKAVVADMMAKADGRIVNVSSIVGVIAAPFLPPYSVSKSAANGLTRVLARQLAPHGITVNAVCPGFVWSELWESLGAAIIDTGEMAPGSTPRDVFDSRISSLVPMRRAQTADEIAAMVAFLCSDSARNITGQIISVDGGVTI